MYSVVNEVFLRYVIISVIRAEKISVCLCSGPQFSCCYLLANLTTVEFQCPSSASNVPVALRM